jgi:hypothetical protein
MVGGEKIERTKVRDEVGRGKGAGGRLRVNRWGKSEQ